LSHLLAVLTAASLWNAVWKIAVAVLVITFMILTHELGHYFAAKAVGIKVDQFSLGFGPEIWGFTRGETRYSLKWLLVGGGSVRIAGMNPEEEIAPEDLPRTYYQVPLWKRTVVIVAGSFVHVCIALVLFYIVFWPIGYQSLTGKIATVEKSFQVGSSLSPGQARVGGPSFVLTVKGGNFVKGSAVKWDNSSLSTTYVSGSMLKAQVPASLIGRSGSARVTVVNPSVDRATSNAQTFLINKPTPIVASLTPKSGSTGDTVTVEGTRFGSSRGDSIVSFNNVRATGYLSWSDTRISVKVPEGAATGPVAVNTDSGVSNNMSFAVKNPVPANISLSPGQARVGGPGFVMTVTGDAFVPGSVVRWNSNSLDTTYQSGTRLTARVPASLIGQSGSQNVTVSNPSPAKATSSAQTFLVNKPMPALTSIAPASGLVGEVATIDGTRFGSKRGNAIVIFNNTEATHYVSWSDTRIRVKVPDGATTGPVAVSTDSGISNEVPFGVKNVIPTNISLDPQQAKVGGPSFTLTVKGRHFVAKSQVIWDNNALPTTFSSDTLLTAKVPASYISRQGYAKVTVFNPSRGGGMSAERTFSTRRSISPKPHISVMSTRAGPAYTAGLKRGDLITSVDGVPVEDWNQLSGQLSRRPGQVVTLVFDRGIGQRTTLTTRATMLSLDGRGILGIQVDTNSTFTQKSNPVAAVGQAFKTLGTVTVALGKGIASLFSMTTLRQLVGVAPRTQNSPRSIVGAAQLSFQAAQQGTATLLFILGELFLVLALFNLLPLPPLDGGHLLVIIVQKVFHKEIDMKTFAKVAWVVIIVLSVVALRLILLDVFNPLKSPF
jgi:membrane-associated protease RseP (regulator of RpoE activity)